MIGPLTCMTTSFAGRTARSHPAGWRSSRSRSTRASSPRSCCGHCDGFWSGRSFEAIVVDNGSRHGSAAALGVARSRRRAPSGRERCELHARPRAHPGHVLLCRRESLFSAVGLAVRFLCRDQPAPMPSRRRFSQPAKPRPRRGRLAAASIPRDGPFPRVLPSHRSRPCVSGDGIEPFIDRGDPRFPPLVVGHAAGWMLAGFPFVRDRDT